jgi:antitoxin (DNA-binding transcriptional repressor) of toxin-antitoxin stability system
MNCDVNMDQVKKASVSELRYRFSVVERLLREGEEVQITRRGRVIARLLPSKHVAPIVMPDFLGRMKKIFGKRRMKMSGAEQIALDRSDRF